MNTEGSNWSVSIYVLPLNIVAAVVGGLPGACSSPGSCSYWSSWSVVMASLFLFGYVLFIHRVGPSEVPAEGQPACDARFIADLALSHGRIA